MAKHLQRLVTSFSLALVVFFAADIQVSRVAADDSFLTIPQGLDKAVEFWKRIFTEYTTSQLVFFDPTEPDRIYRVVDIGNETRLQALISAEKAKILSTEEIDAERIRVQRGIKDRFADGLVRSGRYIDQMQKIFQEHDLPVELTYLPLVESSFNINARSSAGAVGMWQFIRSTGRRFLRIDRQIDERRDPLESTRAAALLLKENYQRLGSWPLAITAYNHGPEGLSRAVETVGSSDLAELIRNYQSRTWGFASKNFYAEFLAAVEVAKNVDLYFPGLEFHPPLSLEAIELEKPSSVAALLRSTGIPQNQFFEWNPALSSRVTVVPRGYRVKVAAKTTEKATPAADESIEQAMLRHRVRRGETLSQIARRYAASVEQIQQINGLERIHLISAGQELLIPKPPT